MISEYLDAARNNSKIQSDYALSKKMALSREYISQLRHGKSLPSDAVMLQLAELAGRVKEIALLDLAAMRASSEDARRVYVNLKKRITSAVVLLFMAASFTMLSLAPAHAARNGFQNYILCDNLIGHHFGSGALYSVSLLAIESHCQAALLPIARVRQTGYPDSALQPFPRKCLP